MPLRKNNRMKKVKKTLPQSLESTPASQIRLTTKKPIIETRIFHAKQHMT